LSSVFYSPVALSKSFKAKFLQSQFNVCMKRNIHYYYYYYLDFTHKMHMSNYPYEYIRCIGTSTTAKNLIN